MADWANGLIALFVTHYFYDFTFAWWQVPAALLMAMSPDIDAIPELYKRGKVSASADYETDHREGLHYPLIIVPVLFILAYVFGAWFFMFAVAVFLHFINDLYGTGWGLKLFWPFSKNNFKILGRKVNWSKADLHASNQWNTVSDDDKRLRFLVSWSPIELPKYIRRWGIDDWIPGVYLKINWISAIEYSIFFAACVLLISLMQ